MYRHELKYIVSDAAARVISQRLLRLCSYDGHADARGRYRVTSLYFDDFCNSAVEDNLSGQLARKKFRIRMYNGDNGFIRLERKIKRAGGCRKDSALLTPQDCERIRSGDVAYLEASENPVLRDFAMTAKLRLLKPKVVVDYTREAYVYEPGSVRVTFDRGVRASVGQPDLLDPHTIYAPAGEGVILEVKYTGFLPGPIAGLVQQDCGLRQAASKYTMCRMSAW
jgi:hypothetical protein